MLKKRFHLKKVSLSGYSLQEHLSTHKYPEVVYNQGNLSLQDRKTKENFKINAAADYI